MEVQFNFNNRKTHSRTISLKRLVAQLLLNLQPFAAGQGSFIVNNVPADFYVHTDENNLAVIISYLLNSIIGRSRRSCIRVNVKRYNNIILFHLSDSNTELIHTSDHDWQEVNRLAGKLGGCIIEDDIRKKHATVTFSFCSLANAA